MTPADMPFRIDERAELECFIRKTVRSEIARIRTLRKKRNRVAAAERRAARELAALPTDSAAAGQEAA